MFIFASPKHDILLGIKYKNLNSFLNFNVSVKCVFWEQKSSQPSTLCNCFYILILSWFLLGMYIPAPTEMIFGRKQTVRLQLPKTMPAFNIRFFPDFWPAEERSSPLIACFCNLGLPPAGSPWEPKQAVKGGLLLLPTGDCVQDHPL